MVLRLENIKERLKKLEEVLSRLEKYKGIELESFIEQVENQWIVERGLIVATAIIFDVGDHILAGYFKVHAETYEEILKQLKDLKVISLSIYEELRGLGGFRNILVHDYLKIDPTLVYENFQKACQIFPRYISEILKWVENLKSK